MMHFLTFFGLHTTILVLIGAFIGWHIPEPIWAKIVYAKLQELYTKIKAKVLKIFVRK